MDNLPLLELFTRLREAGLPLGIDDYQAVLQALQAGFGLENKAALARLCRTLWIKSAQDQKLFDYHFEKSILNSNELPQASRLTTVNAIPEQVSPDDIVVEAYKTVRWSDYLVLLISSAIPVGVFVLVFGVTINIWRANKVPIFISKPIEQVEKGKLYRYQIKAYDVNRKDKLTIKAVTCPSWLSFKDYQNGTAVLEGTEGSEEGNCQYDPFEELLNNRNVSPEKPKFYNVKLQVKDEHGAESEQSFNIKLINNNNTVREVSIWSIIRDYAIAISILLTITYVTLGRSKDKNTREKNFFAGKSVSNNKREQIQSENSVIINNEIKLAETLIKTSQTENIKHLNRFIQIIEYPPLSRRQMKQSWRYLRRMVQEGVPTEIDVEATINNIGRQGVFLEPVLVPCRINRSKLVLLVDHDGSMIPFKNLSYQLTETAMRGGRLDNTDIYYFHNCPIDYLYRDRYYQMPETIEDILNHLRLPHTSVLIFSDAGAARGSFNPEREEVTAQFLQQLKQQVRHIAWLNPIPRSRWLGTTAGKIAQLVPMFELSRQGLHNAIAVLRGQSGNSRL
ncbi:MAG TPA: hypothetical protein IGS40_20085 [Trichormus sp. M33_DOE_039]|nr:hypothetical protein [Trichormus sp. M33_DOE_039]